jgi:hypothetical protein
MDVINGKLSLLWTQLRTVDVVATAQISVISNWQLVVSKIKNSQPRAAVLHKPLSGGSL